MSLDTGKAVAKLRSLTRKFDNRVESATPFYPRVCTLVPSDGADEEYGMLGSVPGIREWVGDRVFNELRGAKFTVENKEWENSVRIKRTDIEDDRLGLYGPVLEQMGLEAATHPDELIFETLIAGGESAACFDGQYFFDTDHSWGDSGTQSNDLTYNATDHTAVTAAEFKAAYHAVLETMVAFKNEKGKLLNRPVVTGLNNILIVVPPQLWDAAVTGLKSQLLGGGDSNVLLAMPEIVCSPHLTSGTKFYVFNLGGVLKPFVYQARRPLSRQMKGLEDREFKDVKFMTDARYNAGYLAWWTAVLTTFN